MRRPPEISICADKLLYFLRFWSQTAALCCVRLRTCYDAGPQVIYPRAGSGHGAVW